MVLAYFLIIAPGKSDNTVLTRNNSANGEVSDEVPGEKETSIFGHAADGALALAEGMKPADTNAPGNGTGSNSPGETRDTSNGTQDIPGGIQDKHKETHDVPGEAENAPGGMKDAAGEMRDATGVIQNGDGETSDAPGEAQDITNEALDTTGETRDNPDEIQEARNPDGEVQNAPGKTQDTAGETQGVPGEMRAADVIRKLYSYSKNLDRYQEALELLTEDFTLELEIFKQFGIEKMNKSDITGEQIGVFAMFLKNSEFRDILEEISEGDNAVIEYLHAMRLVDGSVIEIELAADLVKEAGTWKIAGIREV